MDNVEWHPFFYNGQETNIEVTRCGRVRRVPKDWIKRKKYKDAYEIDFSKLKKASGYNKISFIYEGGLFVKAIRVHAIIAYIFLNHLIGIYKEIGLVVDHIDSNKLNNHVDNLRIVTTRENCSREKTFKSGLPTGVSYNKQNKKYITFISIKRINKYLGYHINVEEASKAYEDALSSLNKFLKDTDKKGDVNEWFYSYRAKMKEPRHNIGEQLAIHFN